MPIDAWAASLESRLDLHRRKETRMAVMAAPLAAGSLAAWEAWLGELNGPRKAEFEEMNRRHGLTAHEAYLQPTPDGHYMALVVHGGPGGGDFLASLAGSDDEFDRWFIGKVAEIHGIDPSGPLPPPAERRL
jgi:hypothetical protein